MSRARVTASKLATALIAAGAAAACGSRRAPGGPLANTGDDAACVDRTVAHENAEAVNVAVGDGVVAWQGYNFGELRVLDPGATKPRTLVTNQVEHNTEDLLVHGGHAYWSSKAERGLFRVPLAGGQAERLCDTGEDGATGLARVGDTIYLKTYDKKIYWWSPDGDAKSIVTSQSSPALAGRDSQLYLGREYDVASTLDLAKDPPHQVATTEGRVLELAVTGAMLYWVETIPTRIDDVLVRQGRSGGRPETIAIPKGVIFDLVATDGGVFLADGDVVLWIDDRSSTPVEVARFSTDDAPGDVAVLGDSVFVGTTGGNVYQRCFQPPEPSGT